MRKILSVIASVIFALFSFAIAIEVWGEHESVMYSVFFLVLLFSWWIYVKFESPVDREEALRIIYFGFIITGVPTLGGVIAVGYDLNPSPFVLGGYVLGIVISYRLNSWLESKK